MRVGLLLIIGVAGCLLPDHPVRPPTPTQLAPIAALERHVPNTIGPLSIDPIPPTTPGAYVKEAVRIAEEHYLDAARFREELATFHTFIETFYTPLTAEQRRAFEGVRSSEAISIKDVSLTFGWREKPFHTCVQLTGTTEPCSSEIRWRTVGAPAFELGEPAPGIALLTVRDLRSADDPAWLEFPRAARTIASARGLVIDMREAVGTDPRPLLPLLRDLTGRPNLAPLRAIERPAAADTYAQAYRARYSDRGRDPEVWRALLGTGDTGPHAEPTRMPIAIVVGRNCDSACELVARVLEAYSNAIVFGAVIHDLRRLGRDEPAMFELPHSHTSVYFQATRYLLAADIEAVTGPTDEWRMYVRDLVDSTSPARLGVFDYVTWAVRDVERRIADPAGWRCDTITPAAKPRLNPVGYYYPEHGCQMYQIEIISQVPPSALARFLATCSTPIAAPYYSFSAYHWTGSDTKPPRKVLEQIASSELVQMVSFRCEGT